MSDKPVMPIVFLAFSSKVNAGVGHSRNVYEEQRRLQEVFESAQNRGQFEVVVRHIATPKDILDVFNNSTNRNRIRLFHYRGHVADFSAADFSELVTLLGQQDTLDLLFLNGRSTQDQVDDLLANGVPRVIAATHVMDDKIATHFALRFYWQLLQGERIVDALRWARYSNISPSEFTLPSLYLLRESMGEWTWMLRSSDIDLSAPITWPRPPRPAPRPPRPSPPLPPPAPDRPLLEVEPSVDTVMRYTDINCPSRVWANEPRISVVVRLTVLQPSASAASEQLTFRQDIPVQMRLQCPSFEILNEPIQEVAILPDRDSTPIVFDLRPRLVGQSVITIDFLQGGNPVGTATVQVEVIASEVARSPVIPAEVPPVRLNVESDPPPPPDMVLCISWEKQSSTLHFTLVQQGGAWWRDFTPVAINGDPAAHAAQLYGRITAIAAGSGRDLGISGNNREIAREDADRQLKKLGQNLWEELIPLEMKRLYATERQTWRNRSLLIYSDEPYFPWELIWPYDDEEGSWTDDDPWCYTLRLTRWLRRDGQGNGNEGPPSRLHLQYMAVLAPAYLQMPTLPYAQREQQNLFQLAQRHSLQNVTPVGSNWLDIMDFLEDERYDWVHFAAHGGFSSQVPDGDSVLWLEENRTLTPQQFTGPAIRQHFRRHRPGFFLNACEVGRQGWSITRIGGWANQLVSLGAAVFVAPLWMVNDKSASTFADAFYEYLLAGETMAVATQKARLDAKQENDPTWLAYSVYAHPNARVEKTASRTTQ